jgi:two-component system NtrC family sensor kinase
MEALTITAMTPIRNMLRRLTPRSLRRQFSFAVTGLALLILAEGATAIYALHANTNTTRLLVEERVGRMKDAQDLVRHTLLIEREAYLLASADDSRTMHASYTEIDRQLSQLDLLVNRMAAAGGDNIAVLDLHHASQLFRNTVNIVAQLRENELKAAAKQGSIGRRAFSQPNGYDRPAQQFRNEFHQQASSMVASAQTQSDRLTQNLLADLRKLTKNSSQNQQWVTLLLAGSLLLAWLVAHNFLGKHVLDRLQLISRSLRQSNFNDGSPMVSVQGDDEIGEMARSVEQFQKDRRQLVQRSAELEAANKELDDFSYSMSHDMRTPLRALDGFSKILLEEHSARLDAEGERLLKVLRSSAQRMGRQIDDILRYLELGKREMGYTSVDIARLASEIVAELQAAAPSRRMHLKIDDIPGAWCDRNMIRQALLELLSNAVKFSAAEGNVEIDIGGKTGEEQNSYYVKNRVVGFDMRYAHKLFRVFERVHPTGQYEGSGIGLAIVKRIVERHGGNVRAEGKEGEGATFYFTLPCRRAQA